MEFLIQKENGRFRNLKKMEDYNKSLPDGRYKVVVEKADKRTNQQNRYYFGLVIPMITEAFKDLGHELSAEETHEFLKSRFNSKQVTNQETGETLELPLSTTRLSKTDFGEYIERIQRFGAEFLGINIPDPNTQLELIK